MVSQRADSEADKSRLSGQVYDQTKSADLSETQAVRGSGLVGSVQWKLETIRPDPTNDKVWSGQSSLDRPKRTQRTLSETLVVR